MTNFKKAVERVMERNKINIIASTISLVACLTMCMVLGAVTEICNTIEAVHKNDRHNCNHCENCKRKG